MDELKKALKSDAIVSCGFGEGTKERGWFHWNKETNQLERLEFGPVKVVNAPYVITDEMPPTMSMTGTDKIYTSKRAIRQEYKDLGFREIGDSKNLGPPPCPRDAAIRGEAMRDTIARAKNDIKYNNAPATERQKQFWKDEERAWKNR
jgi:hypothetical protein